MVAIKQWLMGCGAVVMGVSVAQAASSSVQVYGEIDTALARTYTDAMNMGMVSSYTGDTKLGFKGSEDLGNGLKLNFQLEASGMNSDTGAWTGAFQRQSWVGFSGAHFGDFKMGRTTTPQNRAMGQFDLNGSADGSSALKLLNLGANNSLVGARESNQVQYTTPSWQGLQGRVAYGFSETVHGAHDQKRNFFQVAGTYKHGGLVVGATYQPEHYAAQKVTAQNYRDGYAVGAKYDFGMLQVSAFYTRNVHATDGEGGGIGVMVPWDAWELGLQMARVRKAEKADGSRSDKQGAQAMELFANYRLSKRTSFYGAYGKANTTATHAFKLKHDNTAAIGITHKF